MREMPLTMVRRSMERKVRKRIPRWQFCTYELAIQIISLGLFKLSSIAYISIHMRNIAVVLLFITVNSILLSRPFGPAQSFCLYEDFPRHSLVNYYFHSHQELTLTIKAGINTIGGQNLIGAPIQKTMTTQVSGRYSFCFENHINSSGRLTFRILHGGQANDFGSLKVSDDLVSNLNRQAEMAKLFIEQIQAENKQGLQILIKQTSDSKFFSVNTFLTLVFGLLSIALSYYQFSRIKRHLKAKKYI